MQSEWNIELPGYTNTGTCKVTITGLRAAEDDVITLEFELDHEALTLMGTQGRRVDISGEATVSKRVAGWLLSWFTGGKHD